MRTIKARFASTCAGCGGPIGKGDTITGSRGTWYHGSGAGSGCAPRGSTTRADHEYQAGAAEAERWMADRRMFGEEFADAIDMDAELRDPEGW